VLETVTKYAAERLEKQPLGVENEIQQTGNVIVKMVIEKRIGCIEKF
jgi:hypothetical protein